MKHRPLPPAREGLLVPEFFIAPGRGGGGLPLGEPGAGCGWWWWWEFLLLLFLFLPECFFLTPLLGQLLGCFRGFLLPSLPRAQVPAAPSGASPPEV